jgi:hypothetical protein
MVRAVYGREAGTFGGGVRNPMRSSRKLKDYINVNVKGISPSLGKSFPPYGGKEKSPVLGNRNSPPRGKGMSPPVGKWNSPPMLCLLSL